MLETLFCNETLRSRLFQARFLLALVVAIIIGRYMHPERLWLALAISMVGQLIQVLCFAALTKNTELSMRGPYLVVRNPMYLGRYLLLLGFVLLLGNLWWVAIYTLIYCLYVYYRVLREESNLLRFFGEEFKKYCEQVPRFFPTLRHLGNKNLWFFDKKMFFENNSHWNILGTLVVYAAIYGAHEAFRRFGS